MNLHAVWTGGLMTAALVLNAAVPDLAEEIDPKGTLFDTLTPENLQNNSVLKSGSFFKWVSAKRDAARYQALGRRSLTLFSEPVPEAILQFKDGRLDQIYVAVYNRGDSGTLADEKAFDRKVEAVSAQLTAKSGGKMQESKKRLNSKNTVFMRVWDVPPLMYCLRWSSKENDGVFQGEYILVSVSRSGGGASVIEKAEKTASSLPKNVKHTPQKDVYIDGIPMVDQGKKGYCVPAVVERILKYYGVEGVTQHTIAQIGESDAGRGTNVKEMYTALKRISNKFGCRLEEHYMFLENLGDFRSFLNKYNSIARRNKTSILKPVQRGDTIYVGRTMRLAQPDIVRQVRLDDKSGYRKFGKKVHDSVDRGIPLIWCVPGHMRLIIGYNDADSSVVFSDTWGVKHEFKKMPVEDAWVMTYALYTMEPRKK